jgi:hypothetical protein
LASGDRQPENQREKQGPSAHFHLHLDALTLATSLARRGTRAYARTPSGSSGGSWSLFSYFRLQRPKLEWLVGSGKARGLDLCRSIIVALAVHQAGQSDLIRSPTRVLAHLWEVGDGRS